MCIRCGETVTAQIVDTWYGAHDFQNNECIYCGYVRTALTATPRPTATPTPTSKIRPAVTMPPDNNQSLTVIVTYMPTVKSSSETVDRAIVNCTF